MTAMTAIFKRELRGYFSSPLAYVFLVVFLVVAAWAAFADGFFALRDASLRTYFQNLPALFAFLGPAIAARMWADERRTGTIELLLSLPVTVNQAVLGKFLAGWAFFAIALLLSTSMAMTVSYLGDPDIGPVFTGYFGAFLMAGAYLAIGCFFSAVTKSQTIAFVLGFAACTLLVLAGSPSIVGFMEAQPMLGFFAPFAESMGFLTHYDVMQRGMIEFRNVFFMIAIAAGFLVCTVVMLRESKAR
jgi:ABC-2 type transport system permease protein